MAGHLVEHVVEEANAGADGVLARAVIELDHDVDIGLPGLACHLASAGAVDQLPGNAFPGFKAGPHADATDSHVFRQLQVRFAVADYP